MGGRGESAQLHLLPDLNVSDPPASPVPPLLPRAAGRRGPISGDTVPLAAGPAPAEAQGERPSCLSSRRSVVQLRGQALPSSLQPRRRETETRNSRTRHCSCGFPTNPPNFRRRDLGQGCRGSPSSPDSCPPPAGPCRGWDLARAPAPLAAPQCPPQAPVPCSRLCSCSPAPSRADHCPSDAHGATCRPAGAAPGERPWHVQSAASAPHQLVVSAALPGAARTLPTSDSLYNCCSAQKAS